MSFFVFQFLCLTLHHITENKLSKQDNEETIYPIYLDDDFTCDGTG